jgi:hypothetical protein
MMNGNKNKTQENNIDKERKLYCEKYQEWLEKGEGCKHKKEYCQFRKQCIIYINEKYKDF